MADTAVSKTAAARREGSSPSLGTIFLITNSLSFINHEFKKFLHLDNPRGRL